MILLMAVSAIAQDPYHIVFDANDGLPSSEVYDVEIDKYNNLWFSTDRGLSKFNGSAFENFSTNDGLTDNTIFEIMKDPEGNLWFSCYDGSVCYYDYNTFQEAPFNEALSTYVQRNWVRQIYFDSLGNCSFFLGKTTSIDDIRSYFYYDKSKDTLNLIRPDTDSLYIRIGDNEDNDFFYSSDIDYYLKIALLLEDNSILVGYTPELNYMFKRVNSNKYKWRNDYNSQVFHVKGNEENLIYDDGTVMTRIYQDRAGHIYIMHSKGVTIIEDPDDINSHYTILEEYSCSSMLEDSENNIWIATINKGVVLIPAIYIKEYDNRYFSDSRVMRLQPMEDHIIASTFDGNVYSIDSNYVFDKLFSLENRFLELQKYNDTIITFDNSKIYERNGKIKVDLNDPNSNMYSKLFIKTDDRNILRSYHTLLWGDLVSESTIGKDIYTETRAMSLYKDEDDKIWIGTLDGLYWIENYNLNKHFAYKPFPEVNLGRVSTIEPSVHGVTYLGTIGQGLFFHSYSCGAIKHVGFTDDRSTNIINCLYEENDSTLWIGSNNGLFQTKTIIEEGTLSLEVVNQFNTRNGLSSNYIYDIEKWKDKLWIVSEKGLNVFDPQDVPKSISAPYINFDSILVNKTKISSYRNRLFEYSQRNLTFHYNANSFKKNLDNDYYKYTLIKGSQDTVWRYTNSKVVQFTNLPAGDYSFVVKARNQYDNWSRDSAEFNFTVLPHFSQTLIFKILLLFSVMALSYAIYWYRSRQILLREVQKRKLQATEMRAQKAELDALRGQMNPHFVYNALNSIQNYIYKGDEENANYYLSSFSKLMRNSLEMSKLELITIKEELRFLNNYLELEKMRFEDKFDYSFLYDNKLDTSLKIPPLLIQPLVENSIKHGFKNIDYYGNIIINIKPEADHLVIRIVDNGNGINKNKNVSSILNKHKSLSIQIINERLGIINTQLTNFKATLEFNSPVERDGKNVRGTEAILKLPYFN